MTVSGLIRGVGPTARPIFSRFGHWPQLSHTVMWSGGIRTNVVPSNPPTL